MRFSRTRLFDVLHTEACTVLQPVTVGGLYNPWRSYRARRGNLTTPDFRFLILCRFRKGVRNRSSAWFLTLLIDWLELR
jgi:hypothetical protein